MRGNLVSLCRVSRTHITTLTIKAIQSKIKLIIIIKKKRAEILTSILTKIKIKIEIEIEIEIEIDMSLNCVIISVMIHGGM